MTTLRTVLESDLQLAGHSHKTATAAATAALAAVTAMTEAEETHVFIENLFHPGDRAEPGQLPHRPGGAR